MLFRCTTWEPLYFVPSHLFDVLCFIVCEYIHKDSRYIRYPGIFLFVSDPYFEVIIVTVKQDGMSAFALLDLTYKP